MRVSLSRTAALGAAVMASLGYNPATGRRLRRDEIVRPSGTVPDPERKAAADAKRERRAAKRLRDAGLTPDVDLEIEL